MTDDPKKQELDKALADYLSQQSEDKRKGFTLANMHAQLHETLRLVRGHGREIEGFKVREEQQDERIENAHRRLDSHRDAIVALKRRNRLPGSSMRDSSPDFDKEMDTGNFDIAAIQREVEEQKAKRLNSERVKADEITWWKRNIITLVISGIVAIATALFSILITLAIAGASSKQAPAVPVQPVPQRGNQ